MARTHTAARRGSSAEQGVRHARLKLLILAVLCLLPGLGAAQMAWSGQSWLPLAAYPAVSLISLMLYWQDKPQARSQARHQAQDGENQQLQACIAHALLPAIAAPGRSVRTRHVSLAPSPSRPSRTARSPG